MAVRPSLTLYLMYLKENPNQTYHGYHFNMSESKVSEWISYLLPVWSMLYSFFDVDY